MLNKWEGVRAGVDPFADLRAKNFALEDKYGGTQKLRFQTSYSSSSNFKSKSVQFDKADYGALINLANKARKVKSILLQLHQHQSRLWFNQQQHCWVDQNH